MYTWLRDWEFQEYSQNKDEEINEVLQQVRRIDPRWYVSERQIIKRKFFKKETQTFYTLYESTGYMEVRFQTSVVTKRDLMNFLFGLSTGYHLKPNKETIQSQLK
jgi:hypothetical protein